jgi:putative heme degradation protein
MTENEFREILDKTIIATAKTKSIAIEAIEAELNLEPGDEEAINLYKAINPSSPTSVDSVAQTMSTKECINPIDVHNFFFLLDRDDVTRTLVEMYWNFDLPKYNPMMAVLPFDEE